MDFEVKIKHYNEGDHHTDIFDDRGPNREYPRVLPINMLGLFDDSHYELVKEIVEKYKSLIMQDFDLVYILPKKCFFDRKMVVLYDNLTTSPPCINIYYFKSDVVEQSEPYFYLSCIQDIMNGKHPIIYMHKQYDRHIWANFLDGAVDDHEYGFCDSDKDLKDWICAFFNSEYHRIKRHVNNN